jgi:hypothetical protein
MKTVGNPKNLLHKKIFGTWKIFGASEFVGIRENYCIKFCLVPGKMLVPMKIFVQKDI